MNHYIITCILYRAFGGMPLVCISALPPASATPITSSKTISPMSGFCRRAMKSLV